LKDENESTHYQSGEDSTSIDVKNDEEKVSDKGNPEEAANGDIDLAKSNVDHSSPMESEVKNGHVIDEMKNTEDVDVE